jgi:monoterpene epsilon-lactone hydrolase
VIGARRRLLEIFVRRWIRAALDPDLAVDHQRRQVLRAARMLPRVRGVELSSHKIGKREALWLAPKGNNGRGAILYLHGGAYVLGSPRTHCALASRLARLTGLPVVLPDYRLAPKVRCPAALSDAHEAWCHLLDCGLRPHQIAIAGDSAGGGLAVALTQSLAGEADRPSSVVLFSPWVDLSMTGETIRSLAPSDPMLRPEYLAWAARTYLGGRAATDPAASPLFGDFSRFPPMLIQAGGREILLDDAIRLATAARAADTEVRLEIEPGLWHAWQLFAGILPEADTALARAARFIEDRMIQKETPAKLAVDQ